MNKYWANWKAQEAKAEKKNRSPEETQAAQNTAVEATKFRKQAMNQSVEDAVNVKRAELSSLQTEKAVPSDLGVGSKEAQNFGASEGKEMGKVLHDIPIPAPEDVGATEYRTAVKALQDLPVRTKGFKRAWGESENKDKHLVKRLKVIETQGLS